MKVPDLHSVFGLHLFELHPLFRGKECRDFGVRLSDAIEDALHRLAVNRFHIATRVLNEGPYFRHLLIGQVEAGSQTRQHHVGHLMRIRQPHERASDDRRDECAGDGAGNKNQDRVKSDAGGWRFIHNRSRRRSPNQPLESLDQTGG